MHMKPNTLKKKIKPSKELHMLMAIKRIGKTCRQAECELIKIELMEKISAINYFINNDGLDGFDHMDLQILRDHINVVLFQSSIAFDIDDRIKQLKKMQRKSNHD